ncbi:MAG: hypothetical protein IJL21_04955 [Alphaproteobacteria bacterium]|nr:hypothetical protein [Alphaproteobacteria bacterium]
MKNPKTNRVLFLAALMALATACKKDPSPEPTPNHPTDTITPAVPQDTIVPTREIVIPWCWSASNGLAPNMDTIRFYAIDPTVKSIFIHLIPGHETTWEPIRYNRAHDSLQLRINIDTSKVHGRGDVKVGRDGAHISPDTLTTKFGMWEPDSLWFANHGWRVSRFKKTK